MNEFITNFGITFYIIITLITFSFILLDMSRDDDVYLYEIFFILVLSIIPLLNFVMCLIAFFRLYGDTVVLKGRKR